jgi:hypothetical protein
MFDLLARLYAPAEIFVSNPRYSETEPKVSVTCSVPKNTSYTKKPIPYLSAENYVRILSQASYLLSHYVLDRKLIDLDVSANEFLKAMEDFELYYRNLAMTFHTRVEKGDSFEMTLHLKDWRVIKRLDDFVLFTFENDRTVISGEMSFIYVA